MSSSALWQCKDCKQLLSSEHACCPRCTDCDNCGRALEACHCESIPEDMGTDVDDEDLEVNYG